MKLSENWLREWVNPSASLEDIAARLVMGGHELEIEPALAAPLSGVVVAKILGAERHPQADRLQICKVDVGEAAPLQIVCGAENARAGMLVPCARIGAVLPGGLAIKAANLRGVDSAGMLCSAKELGLSDKAEGLLELDSDAKPGTPIEQHLGLDDQVMTLEITPNRGDCLSALGLARDVAALFSANLKRANIPQATVEGAQKISVEIESLEDCPNYAGRLITKINPRARTPDWMRERLRRSGIRCIYPIVDITNYVMLELGQPLHAFDAEKLVGSIRVRRAAAGEAITVLSEDALRCDHGELLICDDSGPVALAGVMGGLLSGVHAGTTRVFFESACFAPAAVVGTARRHKLTSDSAYRFERGVDPGLQRLALERATQLVRQICGGEVHPVTQAGRVQAEGQSIALRRPRVSQILGVEFSAKEIEALLSRLGIGLRAEVGETWIAKVPSHRYDLRLEVDLIEEVGRLYGYDRIPARPYAAQLAPSRPSEGRRPVQALRETLASRGWQEIISLAFVDAGLQERLQPAVSAVPVDNPIADNLTVMRSTLWSGLLPAWLHNRARQQERQRLFEIGVRFALVDNAVVETASIAGLASGRALPEQWASDQRAIDFYDLKNAVEALLGAAAGEYRFEADHPHPALHPGRSARLLRDEAVCGWLGELHPGLVQALNLPESPLLFELDSAVICAARVPAPVPLSEFPSSRRDLAIVVDESVSAARILASARSAGGPWLRELKLFDLYRGPGLKSDAKSIAIGLIFNDNSRTLTDEDVDAVCSEIANALAQDVGAAIRQ